jgi:nitric-oxide synthase
VARRSEGTNSGDMLAQAQEFLELFHREVPSAGSYERRWAQVRQNIEKTGSYWHTHRELAFGARVAWRHSVRCVGRVRWPTLVVRDARRARTTRQVCRELVRHMRFATNGGRIRSTITIFAPDDIAGPQLRIWNEQLVRYAGWRRPDGSVLGDPRNVGFTDLAQRLGWQPPAQPTAWDLLPWVVETAGEEPRQLTVPRRLVLEVPIEHPDYAWFAQLGLRWHAVPVVSHMRLHIGGINYSAAPFNGFYLGDEIASRNLADNERYDQVRTVAREMGLNLSSNRSLWRDRAVIELNRAVLHSFDTAGVSITDHHTEARHFMRFASMESDAGRCPHADWAWINAHPVPPQTPTFHRLWDDEEIQPNFWLDDDARRRANGEMFGPTLKEARAG